MIYCDIHTHQAKPASGNVLIVNKIVDHHHSFCFLPGCYYSYGIHPWHIEDQDMQLTLLTEALFNSSVVALGEAGLDKHIDISLSLQREIFAAQVELSEEFEKPLVVHCVKAWDELLAVKKELKPRKTWVIHGFRGNRMLAEQLVRKGFYLSFGARFNTEALHAAWPNRLLAETDEAETSIEDVYAAIANALNVPIPLLALELRKNVKEVFSI